MEYAVIEFESGAGLEGQQMIVADERVEHILSHLPEGTSAKAVAQHIPGSQLTKGSAYYNVFSGESCPIVSTDFVTSTSGTGLVHMAPGHGMEDYTVCNEHGIGPAFAPVDDEGRYTGKAFPADPHGRLLTGLDVQTDGVKAVLHVLKDPSAFLPQADVTWEGGSLVLASHQFIHKNPIDWRTKQPIITRATEQWFADVSAIKERAMRSLESVEFIPETGVARLKSFVEGRSQWCISRQRAWGVPIPALYHKETGEAVITDESVAHIISTINKRGTDAWFADPSEDAAWLHPGLEKGMYVRGKDTMDVWFDSGTTWTTLAPRVPDPPADVYVEGTDQHRGWFQSSLLTLNAVQDLSTPPFAPFRTLVTHGFTLDEKGRKMSKSLGNVISPQQILDGTLLPPIKAKKELGRQTGLGEYRKHDSMGPDALRLWVASSDYTKDVTISEPVLKAVHQALQKYRVTFKWILGVMEDYPAAGVVDDFIQDLWFADQMVLHALSKRSSAVWQAYSDNKFYKAVNEINQFVNVDLSAAYFEVIKDRLYADDLVTRRHTQAMLFLILEEMMHMLAPITPHLIEEVWQHMPEGMRDDEEVLHPLQRVWESPFQAAFDEWDGEALDAGLAVLNTVGTAVKAAQEEARQTGKLGSGLACRVELHLPTTTGGIAAKLLTDLDGQDELSELFVVSEVQIVLAEQDPDQHEEERETPAWRYEVPFECGDEQQKATGKAVVLPPQGGKCTRCWQYTVVPDLLEEPESLSQEDREEAEVRKDLCVRCQFVLKEMVEMAEEKDGEEGEEEEEDEEDDDLIDQRRLHRRKF